MALHVVQPDAEVPRASSPALTLDETILELLPAAVCVCDASGTIVRFNRKAAELWGRSPRLDESEERFCGAQGLFWPDGQPLPHHQTPVAAVLATGEPAHDLEVVIERPNGTRIDVLANIAPIRNEAGEITGAISCFQDISARKLAERKVQESQDFLRAVVETTPECVKVVAEDGTLLQMNGAGLRMIEADDADTVHGASTFDLIAPEWREAWQDYHRRVCRGEKLRWEFEIIGLRGTRRRMETHAVPLPMPDGTTAQLAVTRDVSRRYRQEALLREREQHMRDVLEALPAAVYTTDAEGRIIFYNDAATKLWGHCPELGSAEWCGSWRLYRPDGTYLPHDECPMATALKEGRPIRGAEAIAERPDGTRVPFIPYPTPLYDSEGKLVGAVNMLVDITDRKRAEESQQLLINELNHRVKNTLASVQSIAAQSFRHETAERSFGVFEARLIALSKAHDVLTREHWESANLYDIVVQAITPLSDSSRFDIIGPALRITPKTALSFAMAVHELCTNAWKYGALSNGDGRVAIEWQVADRRLRWRWTERGGPPVEPPRQRGFGSRLIERGLAHELNGDVKLVYSASGIICEIDAPLA